MNAARTSTKTPETPVIEISSASGYETDIKLFGSRYKQGGRTVYALDLSLAQIADLITPPNPDVASPGNRAIRPKHAHDFATYLRQRKDWVMPGMLLRAPGIFDFDMQAEVGGVQFGVISFARRAMADLHILDGQHRILGINYAQQGIAADLDKARSNLAAARKTDPKGAAMLEAKERIAKLDLERERLEMERASIQIFVEEDLRAYRQMFFDIADNALGITASVKSRFDSRKVVNRALPLAEEHPLLAGRIDPERDRAGRGSPYLMGAKHVAEIIRTVNVGLDGRVSRRQEEEFKEDVMANRTKDFLTLLAETMPDMQAIVLGQLSPLELRAKSLLGSVLFVRILGGVYFDLVVDRAWDRELVKAFFSKLAPHMSGPAYEGDIWTEHVPDNIFTPGAMAPRQRRQDLKALREEILGWAIDKPAFLDAEPAPRPETVPEEVSTEEEMRVVDEILATNLPKGKSK